MMVFDLVVWMFNLCGDDVMYMLVGFVFVIFYVDVIVDLFVVFEKIDDVMCVVLGNGVCLYDCESFVLMLVSLLGKCIVSDFECVVVVVFDVLKRGGVIIVEMCDFVVLVKVIKNYVE